jgi:hypothetical protein
MSGKDFSHLFYFISYGMMCSCIVIQGKDIIKIFVDINKMYGDNMEMIFFADCLSEFVS